MIVIEATTRIGKIVNLEFWRMHNWPYRETKYSCYMLLHI
jgi:hypothetical protein